MDERRWWLWGCGLWILGSVGFLVSAARSGDALGVAASACFIVGIGTFMVPMLR